ncbi:MAG: cation diffusion facilitator family transporter [Trueperaceae bacterium]
MSQVRRATVTALAASVIVLAAKFAAFVLTDSVALLSDAAESLVNVAAAATLIYVVRLARRPADYEHPYGHAKAEYLSGALEGSLILVSAGVILATAAPRLFAPAPLQSVTTGLLVVGLATAMNAVTAWYLRRVSGSRNSPALAAASRHLVTDVWTSAGILAAVAVVQATGLTILDPLIAILVGLHIMREGWSVTTGAVSSLLDVRLPESEEESLMQVLQEAPSVLGFHRLRSRQSGFDRFVEVDIFVNPELDVLEAHEIASQLELRISRVLPNLTATLHIEPFLEGERDTTQTPRDEFEEGSAPPSRRP